MPACDAVTTAPAVLASPFVDELEHQRCAPARGSADGRAVSVQSTGSDRDFIRDIVAEDLRAGRAPPVVTRFPPEPNGYLHIGHAKSICLNFGIAQEFGGRCNLRFDDTNPTKEEQEYIDAIQADVRWLGFDWGEHLYHASDYFEQLYDWAVHLIQAGKAYVDDLSADEIREHRGTLTEPGRAEPVARPDRSRRTSTCSRGCARASSPTARACCARGSTWRRGNINLRDPVLYRILHAAAPADGRRLVRSIRRTTSRTASPTRSRA